MKYNLTAQISHDRYIDTTPDDAFSNFGYHPADWIKRAHNAYYQMERLALLNEAFGIAKTAFGEDISGLHTVRIIENYAPVSEECSGQMSTYIIFKITNNGGTLRLRATFEPHVFTFAEGLPKPPQSR